MTNPAPKPRLIASTVVTECRTNRLNSRVFWSQEQKHPPKNKQISIPPRTKRNDSLKIGPCVKKARAPMSPKIACPCMRQLSEIEPKGTPHTEPSSVGSSTRQDDRSVGARTLACSTADVETVSPFLQLLHLRFRFLLLLHLYLSHRMRSSSTQDHGRLQMHKCSLESVNM